MICEAISGDGTVLPPMVILSGVLNQRRWYTSTNIPDDTLIALSDTGYSNDDISLGWLAHFERFTSRRKTGAYRLLLLDGYGSHCTKQFIDYCDRYNIIPFCFPPHTTTSPPWQKTLPSQLWLYGHIT